MLWAPFILSRLLSNRSTSKCTLLPQKHSFSSTVLQPKTTPGSGYPSLHFLSPLLARLSCSPSTHTGLGSTWVSPFERDRHVGTCHGSLRHRSILYRPFSISAMGINAARDFPSNPHLKITLGCGWKASQLTLPHRALF